MRRFDSTQRLYWELLANPLNVQFLIWHPCYGIKTQELDLLQLQLFKQLQVTLWLNRHTNSIPIFRVVYFLMSRKAVSQGKLENGGCKPVKIAVGQ